MLIYFSNPCSSPLRAAPAITRCIECGLLCEGCASSHAKMTKLFRTHTVRPMSPSSPTAQDPHAALMDQVLAIRRKHCANHCRKNNVQRDLFPVPGSTEDASVTCPGVPVQAKKGNIWCDRQLLLIALTCCGKAHLAYVVGVVRW